MALFEPTPFAKMHGSGNDFVVIDASNTPDDLVSFTQAVCRRGTSIGADGVIVIGTSEVADFGWRYINADGTDGDMCGNGAMVGARYAVDHGLAAPDCYFETAAGIIHASVDGERVTLRMPDVHFIAADLEFPAMPGVAFDQMIIGVPHVVGWVDDADGVANLDEIGRAIRHDPQLQPAGANVNLVHRIDDHTIRMRTYERGVEAETLACGTGAICSAIASVRRGLVTAPVDVIVSSGMTLRTDWTNTDDGASDVTLSGAARVVATGHITADALR